MRASAHIRTHAHTCTHARARTHMNVLDVLECLHSCTPHALARARAVLFHACTRVFARPCVCQNVIRTCHPHVPSARAIRTCQGVCKRDSTCMRDGTRMRDSSCMRTALARAKACARATAAYECATACMRTPSRIHMLCIHHAFSRRRACVCVYECACMHTCERNTHLRACARARAHARKCA